MKIDIYEEEGEQEGLTWIVCKINGKFVCNSYYRGESCTSRMEAYDTLFEKLCANSFEVDNF